MQELSSPMPEPKARPRNLYGDEFTVAYEKFYGMPYVSETADWVQLDRLLKSEIGARLTVEVWKRGVVNYFASEVSGGHTLKHLCSKFVPYWRGPMNQFGQPKRSGEMRAIGEMSSGLPWPIRFLQKLNKVGAEQPEKAAALDGLLDQLEDERLDEAESMRRLEVIKQS